MIDWVKQHPILAGLLTLGIIILFVVLRGSSKSSGGGITVAGGASDAVQETAIAANASTTQSQLQAAQAQKMIDAAVAIQSLQSNNQLSAINTTAQAQTDQASILASAAVQNTQLTKSYDFMTAQSAAAAAETEAESSNNAMLEAIKAQTGGAVDIAGINANRDIALAGTQSQTLMHQADDAVTAQGIISKASVDINGQNNHTAQYVANLNSIVQNNSIAATLAAALDFNKTDLAKVNSNNATIQTVTQINANRDVDITGLQTAAATAQAGIESATTLGQSADLTALYQHLIDANMDTTNHQVDAVTGLQTTIINAFKNVDFNRGGQGGANQVAAWASLFGQPAVGVAAENANPGFSWGSFLTGLGNLFAGVGKGAQGVGIGAGTAGIATH